MKTKSLIQVFEHDFLPLNEKTFTSAHWKALAKYNEVYGNRFLTLMHNGVKFNEHVGVIHMGNLTIEILPKIDRQERDKKKWQSVLINMLQECHWMQQHSNQQAPLHIKHNSILEAYLDVFLSHCEALLQKGLIKKYVEEQCNLYTLKGKLIFTKHLQRNHIHKERFFTKHSIYSNDNLFNQILLKAIRLVPELSNHLSLEDRVGRILLNFPDVEDIAITNKTFAKVVYDRKTIHYEAPLKIAEMLLLNFRPDITGGNNSILAVLFDMNELWEEYVFRQIKKHIQIGWSIKSQNKKTFWSQVDGQTYKSVKPDIVIEVGKTTTVIDTKWKVSVNNVPSDEDLKQMFVYNEFWQSKSAILLYPDNSSLHTPACNYGTFSLNPSTSRTHNCSVMKISVLDYTNQHLDKKFGNRIVNYLSDEIFDPQ